MADALKCTYGCVAYYMRQYEIEGINMKLRWTPEEEVALLAGEKLNRSEASIRAKRWKLSEKKQNGRDKKPGEVQVTNWLDMKDLDSVKNGFDEKGIAIEVREKKGKYAIFRGI